MALKQQTDTEKEQIDKILEESDSSDDEETQNHNKQLDDLFGKVGQQSRDRGLFSGQTTDSEMLSSRNPNHLGGALKGVSGALQADIQQKKNTNDPKANFGLNKTKYIELSSDESSDDGLEEAEKLATMGKSENKIDFDGSDSSIDDLLKNDKGKGPKKEGYLAEFEAKKGLVGDYKQKKGGLVTQSKTDLYRNADLVTLVELNERQSDLLPEKLIEQASQLLSFEKEFYSVKKELLSYSHFQQISHSLYEDMSHPYSGLVSCIKMFRAKNGNVIFVGNSNGYIRVFDIKTQKQMKPLYHESLSQTKVLCLDISEDGHYLLAGYKKGILVLWDSSKYSMALTMKDVAKTPESEFTQVKILYVSSQNVITIVTAEAQGTIRLVHVTRSYFGSFSHKVNSLYESDLIGAASIAVQRPNSAPEYFSPFCQNACFVAFGATNMVSLVEMRQFPPQPLLTIKRPAFLKESSVPYLDWGYGLTPQNREKTVPLLAVAWERVIMLLFVNEETNQLEFDGYYCCDQEIHMAYFVADSVLFVIVTAERDVTQHEVRMIYTEKFRPGEISDLDLNRTAGEDIMLNANFQGTVEGTKASELETGHIICDLRRSFLKVPSGEKSDRIPTGSHLLKQNSFYNNSVTHFKKNIIFICEKRVMMARLFSWREYIDKLKFTDNQDWLSVLQVALEIYQGDLKGFAMLPDAKERRQEYLKDYMKKLIMTSIQTVIYKYNTQGGAKNEGENTSTRVDSESDPQNEYEGSAAAVQSKFKIEDIAIKVAIEFCLRIGETEFLFDSIFNFFVEKDLQDKFIGQLCAPILASQFRKEFIPEHIVLKLIHMYEAKKEFKVLEKIIQQINLKAYPEDHELAPGQTSLRQHLVFICRAHCLVSALLYLFTSDSKKQGGCQQILEMMLRNMEEKGNLEQHAIKKDSIARVINKEDIRLLRSTDREAKYQIEKSHIYIGYKLLWIVKMFLMGKKFPEGNLETSQWKQHTYHIVDFISNEDNLSELLDFDPEHLFSILVYLFRGKPWEFLLASGDYKFQANQSSIKEQIVKERERRLKNARLGVAISPGAIELGGLSEQLEESGDQQEEEEEEQEENGEQGIANLLLEILQIASERSFRKNAEFAKACYQEFILRIVVAQRQEDLEFKNAISILQNNVIGRALLAHQSKQLKEPYKKIQINYNRFYTAIKSAFKGKKTGQGSLGTSAMSDHNTQIDSDLIIEALKANKLKRQHIDSILDDIKMHQSPLTNVKIQLYENKQDYVEAFMQHINSNIYKKQVFKWLMSTFESLTEIEKESQRDERRAEMKEHGELDFQSKSGQENDSSEEDENGDSVAKKLSKSSFVGKVYPPLEDLRNVVKGKMLTLAQLDTQETMQLIKKYFDDDDYQERLIMTEFLKFPKTQLEYLVSYIQTNEKQIQTTILEDYISQNQLLKTKYEAYLVQFVTLLCQFEPNQIEKWVSKPYFPPEKCLPVVRKFEHDQGEAILCQRSGDHLSAIDVYMGILDKVSIQKLLEQIKLIYRDEPVFLDEMDKELIAKAATSDRKGLVKQKQTSLKQIALFDQILGKACEICLSEDMEFDKRQTGWFIILDYLQNYMIDSSIKCYEAMKSASSNVGGTKYSAITEQNKAEFTEKLKMFITVRINYILRFPGLDIPLELIVKRLNLTFEQIQKLCASKLKHNSVTMRIEQCQEQLIKGQLFDSINDYSKQRSRGYAVEPTKRFVVSKRAKGVVKRKIKGNTICNECLNSIVMNVQVVPIRIFQCSHQFHENCIKGAKRCPICSKLDFAALREEQQDSATRGRGRLGRRGNAAQRARSSSIDSTSQEKETISASTQEEEELSQETVDKQNQLKNSLQAMMTKSLQQKRLEIVEQTFDETCLTLDDFC